MAGHVFTSAALASKRFHCPACHGRPPLWKPTKRLWQGNRCRSVAHGRSPVVRALAVSYFNSADFRSLRPSSQAIYRGIIDRFCIQYGDNRVANLKREHVVKLMAARAERPVAANSLRKVLRAMMKHAVEISLRADDPTRDVKAIRVKSDGYHSWNDDEIARFEKRHPLGSLARLALALLLYTGQRRSDVVRMGPQHIRNGVLHVRQEKTGIELAIPVHPTLTSVIAETPTHHLTFLSTRFGRPFTASYFGQWFREQCDMAGLRHCSAHGLRKAAARRLAEAGAPRTRSRPLPAMPALMRYSATPGRRINRNWQPRQWRKQEHSVANLTQG